MKLLFFADKLPPEIGGMEIHAKYFIQYFAPRHDLIIITKQNGYDCFVNIELNSFEKIDLWHVLYTLRDERCIVFYNSGRWIECFERIRAILPKALIFYRTGGNEIIKAPLSLPIREHAKRQEYWVKTLNRNIDTLIANSKFTQHRLLEVGLNKQLITIISGGIDANNVESAVGLRSGTRHALNCSPTDKLIVCCCRFVEYKRPFYLIKSFAELKTPCKIVLVGDGPLLEESKVLAAKLKLKNVLFVGRVSNEKSLNIIAAADIYCQASTDLTVEVEGGYYVHTEGMGRSLIEAICCGTRVVATDCGALQEFVTSENGTLVKVNGDDKELSMVIEAALSFPAIDESTRIGFVKEFDFTNIFDTYSILWEKKGYC